MCHERPDRLVGSAMTSQSVGMTLHNVENHRVELFDLNELRRCPNPRTDGRRRDGDARRPVHEVILAATA